MFIAYAEQIVFFVTKSASLYLLFGSRSAHRLAAVTVELTQRGVDTCTSAQWTNAFTKRVQ